MTDKALFCFGYGYTAATLARLLTPNGWAVAGTTTRADKAKDMAALGVSARLWPTESFDPTWLDGAEAILVSTPPGEEGCPAFNAAGEAIAERRDEIRWLGYLSTNGVYGDHQGAWVDESSATKTQSQRGLNRLKAEAQWRDLSAESDTPVAIFRLPGIYGPGRSTFDAIKAGRARRIVKPGQVFSRAHVDDIAAALEASVFRPEAGDLFNVADDLPAPPQDVVAFAYHLLGETPPSEEPFDGATMSAMARSFYADNKRVRNERLKSALGVKLSYPTYREGLTAIFQQSLRS